MHKATRKNQTQLPAVLSAFCDGAVYSRKNPSNGLVVDPEKKLRLGLRQILLVRAKRKQ